MLFCLPVIWWASSHLPDHHDATDARHAESQLPAARQAARLRTAHIEDVFNRGYLKVATRISPTIYVPDPVHPQGIEHDLVTDFAASLGLGVRFIPADSIEDAYELVRRGQADFAAAGLTVNDKRLRHFRYGPSYMSVTRKLVHHRTLESPDDITQIGPRVLNVTHGSSHGDWLDKLDMQFDGFVLHSRIEDTLDLLDLIEREEVDYAVVYSHEALIGQHVSRNLEVGFQIGPPVDFAWAFDNRRDSSLIVEAERYFRDLRKTRRLNDLLDRYYAQFETLDRELALAFLRDVERRIQPYLGYFKEAGKKYDIDWRLLAATGYQESKWQPDALSHMGAHGLMQITLPTARELGLTNPNDPRANILSAAKYLDQLRDHVAADVPEPDRSYLALAAYNVGMGHLADARALTRRKGGDPDRWRDVRLYLPLLSEPKYYREARYGFARGEETVGYVENIRAFHDLMIWLEQREARREAETNGLAPTATETVSASMRR